MSYTPNIPLPTQRIADTQAPINSNFTLANTYFGLDHVAFDAAGNNGKHKYVTMIDETATPPAPGASECAMYAKTTGAVTTPFLRRDGLASPEIPMGLIRAYGTFTGGGATVNAINLTSAAFVLNVGFTMTMPAGAVAGTSYGVLVTSNFTGFNPILAPAYLITNATTFTVGFRRVDNNNFNTTQPDFFTVVVLQV